MTRLDLHLADDILEISYFVIPLYRALLEKRYCWPDGTNEEITEDTYLLAVSKASALEAIEKSNLIDIDSENPDIQLTITVKSLEEIASSVHLDDVAAEMIEVAEERTDSADFSRDKIELIDGAPGMSFPQRYITYNPAVVRQLLSAGFVKIEDKK